MSLARAETRALTLAGYALSHGVWCVALGSAPGPALLVDLTGRVQVVPLSSACPHRAAALLDALGGGTGGAALLAHRCCPDALVVRAWCDGAWRWTIEQPYARGPRLRLPPHALSPTADRPDVLDALYDGVGLHPAGLMAWAEAEVG